MKFNIGSVLVVITVATVLTQITASPHHHDDTYTPLIRILKQLRKQNRYSNYNKNDDLDNAGSSSSGTTSGILGDNNKGNEDTTTSSLSSSSNDQVITTDFLGQRPQNNRGASSSNNGNTFSSPEQIQKLIREAQLASNNNNNNGGNNYFSEPGVTRVPPQRIDQINRGVSTILNGVGSGSLERILRGSFMFTRNENVRSVANNVLDSIFGRRNEGN